MRHTKKILALLLALLVAVTMFAACGKDEEADGEEDTQVEETVDGEKEEDTSEEDAEEVEKIVLAFYEKQLKLDKDSLDYVDEDSDYYEEAVAAVEMEESLKESYVSQGYTEELSAELAAIYVDMILTCMKEAEIEIDSVEVDGDTAMVEVVYAMPDFNQIGSMNDDEIFSETEIAEIQAEAALITDPDELVLYQMELVAEKVPSMISVLDITENTATIELEKIDDEWKIVNEE